MTLAEAYKTTAASNTERNELVAVMSSDASLTNKAQVYARVCATYATRQITPAQANTDWNRMTQGQKDIVTVYAQVAKARGLI